MTLSLGATLVLLLSIWAILKNLEKAGAICSLLIVLFYSFGQIQDSLNVTFSSSSLVWLWLLVFLLISYGIVKQDFPESFTKYLNFFSIILFIFPMSTIIFFHLPVVDLDRSDTDVFADLRGEALAEQYLPSLAPGEKPDIYYIIFDSYERADKLLELYGYDNSDFISSLEQRGFYVLSSSRSNYLNTTYSLNTSLNMLYVHNLPKKAFFDSFGNLNNNHVTDFLRDQDYQIVVFKSGAKDTDEQYADIFLAPLEAQNLYRPPINSFEQLLFKTSMGRLLLQGETGHQPSTANSNAIVASVNRELSQRRETISYALEHLPDYAAEAQNHYLFAHILLPHIPFLYGPEGQSLDYQENLGHFWYEPEPENYDEYYIYQIEYLNTTIISTIDRILEDSTKPVIIILQADHGDGNYLDPDNLTSVGVDTRSSILNAIYYSDQDYSDFYPSLTPVNTFRIIFNNWFGTSYPLLPDEVYANEHPSELSPNQKPNFIDACLEFNICISHVEEAP
ncbi:MAG: hypothetical protein HND51_17910 [Chloroflexi bacterium]|nr:hypothetical protein [Chloroflexota bacterium]